MNDNNHDNDACWHKSVLYPQLDALCPQRLAPGLAPERHSESQEMKILHAYVFT